MGYPDIQTRLRTTAVHYDSLKGRDHVFLIIYHLLSNPH